MYITRLDQITPDLTEIRTTRYFQESFVGFQFSEKLQTLILYNYNQSLIGVEFPETIQKINLHYYS